MLPFFDPHDLDQMCTIQLFLFFVFLQSALARQSLYVKFDPLVKAATPRSPGEEHNM